MGPCARASTHTPCVLWLPYALCSFLLFTRSGQTLNLAAVSRAVCRQLQCEQSRTLRIHQQPDQHSELWRRLMPNRSMMVPVWPGGRSFWRTKSSITTYWGQQTTTHHPPFPPSLLPQSSPSSSPTERQKRENRQQTKAGRENTAARQKRQDFSCEWRSSGAATVTKMSRHNQFIKKMTRVSDDAPYKIT